MNPTWSQRPWPRAFLTALQFLTRIAGPSGATRDPARFGEDIARGLSFFPLIGAVVGAISGTALLLADLLFPFFLAVIVALTVEMLVTGALHEDAVADFCDAFGGGHTRDEILLILKDSRIGSFGAAGLLGALALRASGLAAIEDPTSAVCALVVSSAIGRTLVLVVMTLVPAVSAHEGLAKDVSRAASWRTVGYGLLPVVPILAWGFAVNWKAMVVGVALCAAFTVWFRALLLRRLGGATGDCLGLAAYAGIVAMTLGFAMDV